MVRLYLTVLISLLSVPTWSAEFTANVDRTQLHLNEPLLFTLSLINSDTRLRAEGVNPNVDLTLLSDNFNIGRPTASTNYNIYLGQGRSTSDIKVELFPKRIGPLTIPAFEIDGLKSQPITVEVLNKQTETPDDIFVRSGANVDSAWVGQQIVTYIDLYHRVELESASLGSNFETEPVQIELLANWKMPQASHTETINGIEYDVERIAWAVFPNQPGEFTAQLPDIWVTTKTGTKTRLPHQRINFQINALPAELPGDIIVGKPELKSASLPDNFTQYELTPWTLTLKAPVGVTALPTLLPGIALPKGLKLYPDPARYRTEQSSDGIMDVADYTLSIMPLAAGEFELPAIHIPYFDPETGTASLVELPGQRINVTPASINVSNTALNNQKHIAVSHPTKEKNHAWMWQLTTAIMTLLWLTTLLKLWRKQKIKVILEKTNITEIEKPEDSRHPLQKKMLETLNSQTLEQGLKQWSSRLPEDKTVPTAIKALQQYCYGTSKISESELENLIDKAIQKIKVVPVETPSNTLSPWQPKNFYQIKRNEERI